MNYLVLVMMIISHKCIKNTKVTKLVKLSIFILIYASTKLFSQSIKNPYEEAGVILPTPQVSALAKYVDFPVSLYSGIPQISFPLCELSSGKLTVPVSISYHASGIKVEDVPGTIGLGWTLNAGGIIARTIRGESDISRSSGLFCGLSCVTEIDPEEDPEVIWNSFLDCFGPGKDTEPDIFFFNFNGYSGSFYYGVNQKLVFKTPCNLKIIHYVIDNEPRFKVIDEQGVIYYFEETAKTGNRWSFQEYTSWHLTRIEDSNQTELFTFTYRSDDYSYIKVPNFARTYLIHHDQYLEWLQNHEDPICYVDFGTEKNISTITNRQGQQISFNYRNYDGDQPYGDSIIVLNDITAKNQYGSIIKKIVFNNEFIETSIPFSNGLYGSYCQNIGDQTWMNHRLYLESFSEVDPSDEKITYSIEYYGRTVSNKDGLPNRLSCDQDWYGYYNGANNGSTLLPEFNDRIIQVEIGTTSCFDMPVINGDSYIAGSNREPNFTYRINGTIKKITYPTGGSAEFHFSPHPSPSTNPGPDDFYGIRVDSIIYKDSDGSVMNKKSYLYSTPMIGYWPEFFQYTFYKVSDGTLDPYPVMCGGIGDPPYKYCLQIRTHAGLDLGLYEGPLLGSTNVTETSYGGITHYTFSNDYAERGLWVGIKVLSYSPYVICDTTEEGTLVVPFPPWKLASNCDGFVNYSWMGKTWPLGPFPDISWKRGTLLRKSMNTYSIDYDYDWVEIDEVPAMKIKTIIEGAVYLYYYYLYKSIWPKLNGITESKDGVSQITNYNYDNYMQINHKTFTGSRSLSKSSYKYPYDFISILPYDSMVPRNIISPVIEQTDSVDDKFLQTTLNNYYNWGNDVFEPITIQTKQGTNPNFETRVNFHAYDNYGNILSVSKEGDIKTSYYWGYNYSYPVVKAVNATSDDLTSAQIPGIWATMNMNSITEPSKNPSQVTLLSNFNSAVRNALPAAQIYTYTYKPLVGMTSETDPNGKTTYYEYDSFNRLQYIKDQDLNIIQEYKYHYKE